MPKLKTKSAIKKRFTFTGSGKIKRTFAFKRHNLRKRSQSMKRKTHIKQEERPAIMENMKG